MLYYTCQMQLFSRCVVFILKGLWELKRLLNSVYFHHHGNIPSQKPIFGVMEFLKCALVL